jgi:hypothetical protein
VLLLRFVQSRQPGLQSHSSEKNPGGKPDDSSGGEAGKERKCRIYCEGGEKPDLGHLPRWLRYLWAVLEQPTSD